MIERARVTQRAVFGGKAAVRAVAPAPRSGGRRTKVRRPAALVFAASLGLGVWPILGGAQPQWREASPGYQFEFPRDHASHPDYKLEWWYYTGNVQTADGRRFGYQVTFFRVGIDPVPANPSRWAVRDLYMTHLAVSDPQDRRYRFEERLSRAGPGLAGADADRYRVWNEDWSAGVVDPAGAAARQATQRSGASAPPEVQRGRASALPEVQRGRASALPEVQRGRASARPDDPAPSAHFIRALSDRAGVDLVLDEGKTPAVNGVNGISQKGALAGNASHYYSLTRMPTRGAIVIDGERFEVTGESWMDHEFGTSFLEKEQQGWDWLSIQLADGRDLMLYQLRRGDGSRDPRSSGTLIDAQGRTMHLTARDFTMSPTGQTFRAPSGAIYPIRWSIQIPQAQVALDVTTPLENQELSTPGAGVSYWEGVIDVSGRSAGHAVTGRGYLEMTGYRGSLGRIMSGR
jgi:predicted secreted hydrolase